MRGFGVEVGLLILSEYDILFIVIERRLVCVGERRCRRKERVEVGVIDIFF